MNKIFCNINLASLEIQNTYAEYPLKICCIHILPHLKLIFYSYLNVNITVDTFWLHFYAFNIIYCLQGKSFEIEVILLNYKWISKCYEMKVTAHIWVQVAIMVVQDPPTTLQLSHATRLTKWSAYIFYQALVVMAKTLSLAVCSFL